MGKFGNTSKQLDAVFDRVSELSKVQRIVICFSVFILLFVVFWFLSYWPRWQSIGKLDAEHKRLVPMARRQRTIVLDHLASGIDVHDSDRAITHGRGKLPAIGRKVDIPDLISEIKSIITDLEKENN